ncbi:MAG: YegS/Rv2252/BmrU family lipid kinase [Gloeobacteraceae cyanobacterium ES-bin-316]|nr:YegS/Rv2252/BmrU family lipid kinase [Ferruginibacter sp.]
MSRILIYFVNPISGTRGKDSMIETIKRRTAKEKIPFEIADTNAEGDYSFLKDKIVAEKITDIIICGGDGTVNQVSSALQNSEVNVGIIPMGSGNGLALAAGIPANVEKALDIIFAGHAEYIDGFYINHQFSCMLCGLGFDAKVAHDFAHQKKRGLHTYVKQTLKNFFSAKPYPFVIRLKDLEIKREAFFISIANSNQFGNNVTIAPKASISDGLLDVVIVNKMSKLKLLYSLLKQVSQGEITNTRKKFRNKDIFYFQTKKLEIDNLQNAPLHIDGDPAATATHFKIEIVENAFKLLQP